MNFSTLEITGAACTLTLLVLAVIWRPKKKRELILLQELIDKEMEIAILERQLKEGCHLINEASEALLNINNAYKDLRDQYHALFHQHFSLLESQPN